MNRNIAFLLTAIAMAALLSIAFGAYGMLTDRYAASSSASAASAGKTSSSASSSKKTAPAFTVYDKDGKEVSLSDFAGKPVILNFWASWCDPCKREMPYFQTVYNERKGDAAFLMVNLTDGRRETKANADDFISAAKYTFPVYYDTKISAANAYRLSSIPQTVFVTAEGTIHSSHIGTYLSADELRGAVDALLAAK